MANKQTNKQGLLSHGPWKAEMSKYNGETDFPQKGSRYKIEMFHPVKSGILTEWFMHYLLNDDIKCPGILSSSKYKPSLIHVSSPREQGFAKSALVIS